MSKILCFGSLNIDRTYSVDEIVKVGETISSHFYEEFIGGKGLNQSIALSKAGGDVYHAGIVGKEDGQVLVKYLKDSGVNVDFIKYLDYPSGHAIIQIDKRGNNSIIVYGGTNRMVDKKFIDDVLDNFSEGDLILLQNEISNISYIVDRAYEKRMIIAFNPSPFDKFVKEVDLNKITYFLVNEIEGSMISEKEDEDEILKHIIKKYPEGKVVMTVGSRGARYLDKNMSYDVSGEKVDAIDTTGAGDTFCGYFLSSISRGKSVEESMNIANKASAFACTIKGASNSIPEIGDLYETYY